MISLILSYLSPVSVCQLEKSSKQVLAAVINTDFWKKHVKSLSRRNQFVNCLRFKAQEHGYEGGQIFKLIVRADWKLRKMVRELKRFALVIRDEISHKLLDNEHDKGWLDQFNDCEACRDAEYSDFCRRCGVLHAGGN